MRLLLASFFVFLAASLPAQLRVGGDAGAGQLTENAAELPLSLTGSRITDVSSTLLFPGTLGTRRPALLCDAPDQATPAPFDFAAAKPYLAFFCRLELNIEEATRFPVRFRLGEVRGWQQELSKRD